MITNGPGSSEGESKARSSACTEASGLTAGGGTSCANACIMPSTTEAISMASANGVNIKDGTIMGSSGTSRQYWTSSQQVLATFSNSRRSTGDMVVIPEGFMM